MYKILMNVLANGPRNLRLDFLCVDGIAIDNKVLMMPINKKRAHFVQS